MLAAKEVKKERPRKPVLCQVGDKLPDGKKITYAMVDADEDGWSPSTEFLPAPFDLCYLKTLSGTKTGWHTGQSWDGRNVESDEKVIYWKRNKYMT